jgi:hypothetical protein
MRRYKSATPKNNRTLYDSPKKSNQKKRGRPKRYGKKFQLKAKRLRNSDGSTSFKILSKKGKELLIVIEAWNDILMRGKIASNTSQIPFRLIRVRVFNTSSGELLYARGLSFQENGVMNYHWKTSTKFIAKGLTLNIFFVLEKRVY